MTIKRWRPDTHAVADEAGGFVAWEDYEATIAWNKQLMQRNVEMVARATAAESRLISDVRDAFEAGYSQGHDDTVESCYSPEAALECFMKQSRAVEELGSEHSSDSSEHSGGRSEHSESAEAESLPDGMGHCPKHGYWQSFPTCPSCYKEAAATEQRYAERLDNYKTDRQIAEEIAAANRARVAERLGLSEVEQRALDEGAAAAARALGVEPKPITAHDLTEAQLSCEHEWRSVTPPDDCTKCGVSHFVWYMAGKPQRLRAVEKQRHYFSNSDTPNKCIICGHPKSAHPRYVEGKLATDEDADWDWRTDGN